MLYALGEILLVMIGILLALQVNNWNQEQKTKGEEKTETSRSAASQTGRPQGGHKGGIVKYLREGWALTIEDLVVKMAAESIVLGGGGVQVEIVVLDKNDIQIHLSATDLEVRYVIPRDEWDEEVAEVLRLQRSEGGDGPV